MKVEVGGVDKTQELLKKIEEEMTPANLDTIVNRVAWETNSVLQTATPRKWFGSVRRSWKVTAPGLGDRIVGSDNIVMLYLEEGTKDHGPVDKKFLYIPLKRTAVKWHAGLKRGVDYILKKWVRGIAARHIVRDERPKAQQRLKDKFVSRLRQILNLRG